MALRARGSWRWRLIALHPRRLRSAAPALLVASIGFAACVRSNAAPQTPSLAAPSGSQSGLNALAVEPPSALTFPEQSFDPPAISSTTLPNGMQVWHVAARSVPVIQVRVVIRTGNASDRDRPGLARLAAAALASDAAARSAAPDAGADAALEHLDVRTSADAIILSTVVVKDQLDAATANLGAIVRQPRFDVHPIADLRTRVRDRLVDRVRTDLQFVAQTVAFRELYQPATLPHPYAATLPSSEELGRITVADLKALHKAEFGPKAAGVIAIGDVTFDEAVQSAQRAFGSWDAATAARPRTTPPSAIDYTRVVLADRPGASEAAVVVASLAPSLGDVAWPDLWVGRELLATRPGETTATMHTCADRSAADVLALGVAVGPTPLLVCMSSTGSDTAATVQVLLERLRKLAQTDPTASEVDQARQALLRKLAVRSGSWPAFADLAAELMGLNLPNDFLLQVAPQLKATTPKTVSEALRAHLRDGHVLIAAAADANRTADALSRFGDVTVVDPANDLVVQRTIGANPNATGVGGGGQR